jgi:hypothetical protein
MQDAESEWPARGHSEVKKTQIGVTATSSAISSSAFYDNSNAN